MADKIQIKRSSEEGKKPTPEQLADGELALNLKDKKIYAKDSDGVVQEFPAVDAVNVGVEKVNDLTGEIDIKGSDNISVTKSGQDLTLDVKDTVALKSDVPAELNLTGGDGIKINGSYPNLEVENEVIKIDDLSDVDTTTELPQADAVLVFNGTKWVPGTGGGSSDVENLPDLGDVTISPNPPTQGQVLQYTDGQWKNVDVSAAEGRTTVNGLGGAVTLTPNGSVSITQPNPNNDNEIVISASSGIPDANSDGNIYGRKNAGWVAIDTSGGGKETLSELTDTDISSIADDQFLRWDGDDSTGKWKNETVTLAPSNAQQNVKSDWTATSGDAEILNKPELADKDAEKNVQSNWEEETETADAFILNKPTKLSDFQDDLGHTDTDTGIVKLTHGETSVTGGTDREVTFKSSDASVQFVLNSNNEIDFTVPLAGLNIKGVVQYAEPQTQADGKITVNGTEYEVLWDPATYLNEAQSEVAGAALGDLWIVQYQGDANDEGTEADGNGYVYSLDENGVAEWSLVGPIQGPPGADGSSFLPISSTDNKVTLSDDDGTFQIETGADEDSKTSRVYVEADGKFGVGKVPTTRFMVGDIDDSEFFFGTGFTYVRQDNDNQSGLFLINNNAEGNAKRGIWGIALEDGSKNNNSLYIYNSGVSGVGTDPRFEFTAGDSNHLILHKGQLQTDTITTKDATSGDPADGKKDGDKVIRLKGNQVQITDQDHNPGTGGYSLDIRDNRGMFRLRNDDVVNGINDTATIVLDVNSNAYNSSIEFRTGNVMRAEIVKQSTAGNQYWAQYCVNGSASGLEFRTAFGAVTEKTFETKSDATIISTFNQNNDPDSDNYRGLENYVDRLTVTATDIKAADGYEPQTDDSLVTKKWVTANGGGTLPIPNADETIQLDDLTNSIWTNAFNIDIGDDKDNRKTVLRAVRPSDSAIPGGISRQNINVFGNDNYTDYGAEPSQVGIAFQGPYITSNSNARDFLASLTVEQSRGDGYRDSDFVFYTNKSGTATQNMVEAGRITRTGDAKFAGSVQVVGTGSSTCVVLESSTLSSQVKCISSSGTTWHGINNGTWAVDYYPTGTTTYTEGLRLDLSDGRVTSKGGIGTNTITTKDAATGDAEITLGEHFKVETEKAYYQMLNNGFHLFQSDGSQSRFTSDGRFLINTATSDTGYLSTFLQNKSGETGIARFVTNNTDGTASIYVDCNPSTSRVGFKSVQQVCLTRVDGTEYIPTDDDSLVTKKWVTANTGAGGFPIESEPDGRVLIEADDANGILTSWVDNTQGDTDPDKSVADNDVYVWYVNDKPDFNPPYGSPGAPALKLTRQGVLETASGTLKNSRTDLTGQVTGFGLEGIRNSVFYPHVQVAHDSRGDTGLYWEEVNYHFMKKRNPLDTQGSSPCELGDNTSQGCAWESSLFTIRDGGLDGAVHITTSADYTPIDDYDIVTKKYFEDNAVPPVNPDYPIPPIGIGAGFTWDQLEQSPGLYLSAAYGMNNGIFSLLGHKSFDTANNSVEMACYWSPDGQTWTEGFVGGDFEGNANDGIDGINNYWGRYCDGTNIIFTGCAYSDTGKTWQKYETVRQGQVEAEYVPMYFDTGVREDQWPGTWNGDTVAVTLSNLPVGPGWLTTTSTYLSFITDLDDATANAVGNVTNEFKLTKTDKTLDEFGILRNPKWFYRTTNASSSAPPHYCTSGYLYAPLNKQSILNAQTDRDYRKLSDYYATVRELKTSDASCSPDGKTVLLLLSDTNMFYWLISGRTVLTQPDALFREPGFCCAYDPRFGGRFAAVLDDKVIVMRSPSDNLAQDQACGDVLATYTIPQSGQWTHLSISGGVYVLMSASGQIATLDTNTSPGATAEFTMLGSNSPTVYSQQPVLSGTNGRFLISGGNDITGIENFCIGTQTSAGINNLPTDPADNLRYQWSGGDNDPGAQTTTDDVGLTDPVDTGGQRKLLTTQKDANEYFAEEIAANKEEIAKKTAVVTLSQSEYDALGVDVDQDTLYLITF